MAVVPVCMRLSQAAIAKIDAIAANTGHSRAAVAAMAIDAYAGSPPPPDAYAVKRMRKEAKISVKELSVATGIPLYTMRKYDSGVYTVPPTKMRIIAQALTARPIGGI